MTAPRLKSNHRRIRYYKNGPNTSTYFHTWILDKIGDFGATFGRIVIPNLEIWILKIDTFLKYATSSTMWHSQFVHWKFKFPVIAPKKTDIF